MLPSPRPRAARHCGPLGWIAALLWLSGCASAPEAPPQLVTLEVPVEVYRPLPGQLTEPLAYPPAFSDSITVEDLVTLIVQLYDTVDLANRDRAIIRRLTEDPVMPKKPDPKTLGTGAAAKAAAAAQKANTSRKAQLDEIMGAIHTSTRGKAPEKPKAKR
jgi:hypothetical protein